MANYVESIKKLSSFDYLVVIYGFLSMFAPGFLILYLYKPTLIGNLESIKLFVFCFCLSVPILLINMLNIMMFRPKVFYSIPASEEDRNELYKETFLVSSAISFFVSYTLLILAYFLEFDFKKFLIVIVSFELALFLIGLILCLRFDSKEHKKDTVKQKEL